MLAQTPGSKTSCCARCRNMRSSTLTRRWSGMKSDTLRSSSRLGTQRAEKYEPGATILQAVGVFFLSFCAAWRDRRVFLLVRFYVSCRASPPLPPPPHAFPPPLLLLVLLNRECRICQRECHKICQKECQKICQKECQQICQNECQKR